MSAREQVLARVLPLAGYTALNLQHYFTGNPMAARTCFIVGIASFVATLAAGLSKIHSY
jgi:hypothetical protein